MRCLVSVTGMGEPQVFALAGAFAACEPPNSAVLVWEHGDSSVRLVVTAEQLSALCDQVIEWIPATKEAPDGSQPSDN